MTKKQLRSLRKESGLTQAQLAALLEVRPNTVTRWEMGVNPIAGTVSLAIMCVLTHDVDRD